MTSLAPTSLTVAQLRQAYVRMLLWTAFICLQAGVWAWEYCNTFRLDWAIVKGRVKRRPSGACFVLSRLTLTVCYVMHIFFFQNAIRINCQALWACLVLVSAVSINCSNAVFCLRACAIWTYRPWISIPLFTLWLIQVSFWLLDVMAIHLKDALLPVLDNTCVPGSSSKIGAVPLVLTLLVDSACAALMLSKLRGRPQLHDAPSTSQLMHREIQIFLMLSFPTTLAAAILYWVSNVMLVKTALLSLVLFVHGLVSSRAFMALHYAGSHVTCAPNTLLRNGERLKLEILDDLVFRSGCWCYMAPLCSHDDSDPEAPCEASQKAHCGHRQGAALTAPKQHRQQPHSRCREQEGSVHRRMRSSEHPVPPDGCSCQNSSTSCCQSRSRTATSHRCTKPACRGSGSMRSSNKRAKQHRGACRAQRDREALSSEDEELSEAEYIEMLASRSGQPLGDRCAHEICNGDGASPRSPRCRCRTGAFVVAPDFPRQQRHLGHEEAELPDAIPHSPSCKSSRTRLGAASEPSRQDSSYPPSLSINSEATPSTTSSYDIQSASDMGRYARVGPRDHFADGRSAQGIQDLVARVENDLASRAPLPDTTPRSMRLAGQGLSLGNQWPTIAASRNVRQHHHHRPQQRYEHVSHGHKHSHNHSHGHKHGHGHGHSGKHTRSPSQHFSARSDDRTREHGHERQYSYSPSIALPPRGGQGASIDKRSTSSHTNDVVNTPARSDGPSTPGSVPHLPRYRSVQDLSLSSEGEGSTRARQQSTSSSRGSGRR